tara:strand:+ start:86 stop:907 length:822 start_codon:yes stop_codon:yes gene_type:complete
MAEKEKIPSIRLYQPKERADSATFFGLIIALGFIALALYLGGNLGSFVNWPAFLIVIGGTFGVTLMSFSIKDILTLPSVIGKAFNKRDIDIKKTMKELLDIAIIAKDHGVLSLAQLDARLAKRPFLRKAVLCINDGYSPEDIDRIIRSEIASIQDRHVQSTNILYRAAEIAPGMGLIGTLIGLVQMLAQLNDPTVIGPSMAIAILTTLYGAFLGTVIFAPLAAKLERNAAYEKLEKKMILVAAVSIAKKENPRRLETALNSEVEPHLRLKYFD